jgi:hypothetical protein
VPLALVLALVACGGERSFRSHAVYDSPTQQLRLIAFAEGTFRSEPFTPSYVARRAASTLLVCPLRAGAQELLIEFPAEAVAGSNHDGTFSVQGGPSGVFHFAPRGRADEFARILKLAGYAATPGPSLDQLVAVLDGVSSGPKGTPSATTPELVVVKKPSYEAIEPRPSLGSCPSK